MTLKLSTIQKRLRNERSDLSFAFNQKLATEQDALRNHYGAEGNAAADFLDDSATICELIDEAALAHLLRLGEHWRAPSKLSPTSPLAKKLTEARKPWWTLAYDLDCQRGTEPDMSEIGSHPKFTPDALVNRFINETAIRLADFHHHQLVAQPNGRTKRSEEHDILLRELAEKLPSFAQTPSGKRYADHLKIAKAYRRVEPVRYDFRKEAVVLLGEKAYEEELTGKKTAATLSGASSKTHLMEDVQEYIDTIAKLPAYGEWKKAKDPAKVIAMARAIQSEGIQGIAFTANLTGFAFGMAAAANRETGSAIQERLHRSLISEFGEAPDFYFVLERGLGQLPHLHGAIELEPTAANRKRVRQVLKALTKSGNRIASERWTHATKFDTPARWGAYAYKHPITSQSKTGVRSLLRATQSLRRKAEREWDRMRHEQRDAKTIMKRVRGAIRI